jgi:hypothetical protein
LRILDIIDPSTPTEVASCNTPGSAVGLAVSENHAYIADGGSLRIIRISAYNEVAYYDTLASLENVAIDGNYAYVTAGGNGLRIVDISTPSAPVLVGLYRPLWYARDGAVAGNYAYLADGYGLGVINISTPGTPTRVGLSST